MCLMPFAKLWNQRSSKKAKWVVLMEIFMKTRDEGKKEDSIQHPSASISFNLLGFGTLLFLPSQITISHSQIKILCDKRISVYR